MRSRCIRGRGCPHQPAGPCGRLIAVGRSSSPRSTCPSRGPASSTSAGGSGRGTGPVIPAWSAREPSPSARPGPRPYSCGLRLIRTTSRPSRSPWTAPPGPASRGGSSCPAPSTTTDPGPATRWGRSPAGPARRAAPASHGTRGSSPSPAEAGAWPRSGIGSGLLR